jgi:hypothetical protein
MYQSDQRAGATHHRPCAQQTGPEMRISKNKPIAIRIILLAWQSPGHHW